MESKIIGTNGNVREELLINFKTQANDASFFEKNIAKFLAYLNINSICGYKTRKTLGTADLLNKETGQKEEIVIQGYGFEKRSPR